MEEYEAKFTELVRLVLVSTGRQKGTEVLARVKGAMN